MQHDGSLDRPVTYRAEGQACADNARRSVFTGASLQVLPRVTPPPTAVRAHDWHTALPSLCLRSVRAGEHGNGTSWLEARVASAGVVAAVSPTYARELATQPGGLGLHEPFASYLSLYDQVLASRRRSGGAEPPPVLDRVRSARVPRSAA